MGAFDALLMAVWRRKPVQSVIVHSDQGSQYGSDDWHHFCRMHNLIPSMSRRGNCYDNAVVELFSSSLKKERIRKIIYRTREDAKADIFDVHRSVLQLATSTQLSRRFIARSLRATNGEASVYVHKAEGSPFDSIKCLMMWRKSIHY